MKCKYAERGGENEIFFREMNISNRVEREIKNTKLGNNIQQNHYNCDRQKKVYEGDLRGYSKLEFLIKEMLRKNHRKVY